MKKLFIKLACTAITLVSILALMACGDEVATSDTSNDETASTEESSSTNDEKTGLAAFGIKETPSGKYIKIPVVDSRKVVHDTDAAFDSFVWGDFEYDVCTNSVSALSGEDRGYHEVDEDAFNEGMKYQQFGKNNISVVPYQTKYLDKGYTISERQKDEFRKVLTEEFGEEDLDYYYNLFMNISYGKFEFSTEGSILSTTVEGFYYIDGGKIYIFTGDAPTFNPEDGDILEMDVKLDGASVVFSKDGVSRALVPGNLSDRAFIDGDNVLFLGYATGYDQAYENIGFINVYMKNKTDPDAEYTVDVQFLDGTKAVNPKVDKYDKNSLKVSWNSVSRKVDGETVEYAEPGSFEAVLFENGNMNGFTLVADGRYYLYQFNSDEYKQMKLAGMIEDDKLEKVSDEEVVDLISTQAELKDELKEKFSAAGVEVVVNEMNGMVTMDSSILFDVDSDKLSEEGKEYLNKFFKVYAETVLADKYSDRVSAIMVEGHTDTSGGYDYNMDLSERRAKAVADYCTELEPSVKDKIVAKGRSFDDPVYGDDGKVDMAASRRVEFKFMLQSK